MTDTPDLGPVPERIIVEAEQVRRLIEEQFPQWSRLPIEPVANGGWDNRTFHLGTDMVVRLPSASEYAQAVEKEHRWLPALASQLPLPIPVPLAKGRPSADYPHSWSIYQWLDGVTATADRIADPVRFAVDLAGFLAALQSVDAADGPQPGIHNWFRGGTLRTYDKDTQRRFEELDGHVDVELAREIWVNALDARWDGVDRWFHGDVAEGNLLLNDGQLAAVIDFGTCGVGDPACDLAIAWTLLTADGRQAFRDRLSVDAVTWARGRGWALWKALATYSYTYEDPEDVEESTSAKRVLDEIFSEYSGSRSTAPTATGEAMATFTRSDDLQGAEFVDADLRGARFVGADLSGVVMRGVQVEGAEVDAPWLFDGDTFLRVNGVDVIPFVEAELNRRFPGRADRHAGDPDGLRAAWATLERTWTTTLERVATMPAGTVDVSVGGEWSFAQTLRHLVLATDMWLGRAILEIEQPFHPIGQTDSSLKDGSLHGTTFTTVTPSYAEVLEVRAGRVAMVRDFLATITSDELAATRRNPHNPEYPETTLSCLHTILEEEWEHHRYAVRDLDAIEAESDA